MEDSRKISIILLSFNDIRVLRAISSIRMFDDANTVNIIVLDGGSKPEVLSAIRDRLSCHDRLISEKDDGIFDALNKGLQRCSTEFIGWLGSDDLFTGSVRSSDVVKALEISDLFIGCLYYFHGGHVTRKAHSLPVVKGLWRFGFNNPHFATFGRAELLKSEVFDLSLRGADIEYFLKIFRREPRVTTTDKIVTLQEEGGFSNKTWLGVIRTNIELVPVYARHSNWVLAILAVVAKLVFKLGLKIYYRYKKLPVKVGGIESEQQ